MSDKPDVGVWVVGDGMRENELLGFNYLDDLAEEEDHEDWLSDGSHYGGVIVVWVGLSIYVDSGEGLMILGFGNIDDGVESCGLSQESNEWHEE